MTCVHLQQLYRLCQEHDLKIGSADLVHIVCNQCGEQEVCPSTLTDEYDAKLRPPAEDRPEAESSHRS